MAEAPKEQGPDLTQYNALKKMPFVSQVGYFVNVHWNTLSDDDKTTITDLFLKFHEQERKFGAKPHILAYPAFCKALQQLEEKDKRIHDVLAASGDRTTMSKKFQELGFKLGGDVTIIESLLYLFNEKVVDLVTKPPSPCEADLRQAQKELAELTGAHQAQVDKVAQLEADLKTHQDNHKPMQAMKVQQELNKVKGDLDKEKVNYNRSLKAANKKVAGCEEALAKEKSTGTAATAWLRQICEANHIKFAQY